MGHKKVVVRRRKKVYPDEVKEEKFLELVEVSEDSTGRVKLVDYNELIDEMNGRFLSVKKIGELMVKCSGGLKKKVYYSEVLGMLKRLRDRGDIEFERRRGDVIYYKVTKTVEA